MIELQETALLIVDVQEKLFSKIEGKNELQRVLLQAIEAFQILNIPIIISEQYPEKLGSTLEILKEKLILSTPTYDKSTFSALKDEKIKEAIYNLNKKSWVLVGIESHVCVLQSALGLLDLKREVIVLQDGIGSRDINHKMIAISEMRKNNVRISCLETLLFELLGHAKHSKFKEISALLR